MGFSGVKRPWGKLFEVALYTISVFTPRRLPQPFRDLTLEEVPLDSAALSVVGYLPRRRQCRRRLGLRMCGGKNGGPGEDSLIQQCYVLRSELVRLGIACLHNTNTARPATRRATSGPRFVG